MRQLGHLKKEIINRLWHWPKSFLAFLFFGPKKQKIKIIGVCSTKGKTTTSYLIAKISEKAGYGVALISTAIIKIKDKEILNNLKMTTPSAFYLYRFISQALKAGCQYLVLEISSHAIKQHRIFGLKIDFLVITNLSPDHLEYHLHKEDYFLSHKRLANKKGVQKILINGNDPFIRQIKFKNEVIDFSANKELKDRLISLDRPLMGDFNLENYLAASQLALELKIPWPVIEKTIREVKNVAGRLESIDLGQDFKVIVDYAHSPASLQALFSVIKNQSPKRIITVFGACGERDPSQRPKMGEILGQNSQVVIITTDDPYREDPEIISQQVMEGLKNYPEIVVFKIPNRFEAIEKAIKMAKTGDWVLVLGKGAEQFQVVKNKKIPWDDREICKKILLNLKDRS